mmetsp:Transcript_18770/g.48699  ORF Transcript_18770/g.48699 Transcript_18770/m.48699 type:complete len:535 (+) Transcript_18770:20-1624(+)
MQTIGHGRVLAAGLCRRDPGGHSERRCEQPLLRPLLLPRRHRRQRRGLIDGGLRRLRRRPAARRQTSLPHRLDRSRIVLVLYPRRSGLRELPPSVRLLVVLACRPLLLQKLLAPRCFLNGFEGGERMQGLRISRKCGRLLHAIHNAVEQPLLVPVFVAAAGQHLGLPGLQSFLADQVVHSRHSSGTRLSLLRPLRIRARLRSPARMLHLSDLHGDILWRISNGLQHTRFWLLDIAVPHGPPWLRLLRKRDGFWLAARKVALVVLDEVSLPALLQLRQRHRIQVGSAHLVLLVVPNRVRKYVGYMVRLAQVSRVFQLLAESCPARLAQLRPRGKLRLLAVSHAKILLFTNGVHRRVDGMQASSLARILAQRFLSMCRRPAWAVWARAATHGLGLRHVRRVLSIPRVLKHVAVVAQVAFAEEQHILRRLKVWLDRGHGMRWKHFAELMHVVHADDLPPLLNHRKSPLHTSRVMSEGELVQPATFQLFHDPLAIGRVQPIAVRLAQLPADEVVCRADGTIAVDVVRRIWPPLRLPRL